MTEDFKKLKETVDKSDVVSVKKDIDELEKKVNKNTTNYGTFKTEIDNLTKKVDNVKPGSGLPPGDYVKKTDYDKDKATYVKRTDYATNKNKLLSTDEYEKDKRDELALKKDLTVYLKKDELNSSVSTFLQSSDSTNPLKEYVEKKDLNQDVSTFLKSSVSSNPLNDYAKKTYVDDKIKNIKGGGGTVDLSGYTKQTDFITFKDKTQKDLVTLRSDVAKNYTLKKDLDVAGIDKKLSTLMGREFFNGTDGTINEHVYSPDLRQIKFVFWRKRSGRWMDLVARVRWPVE